MKAHGLRKVARIACLLMGLAALALAQPQTASAAASAGAAHSQGAWTFLFTAVTIFGINFVLSGDNGVLIAMAVMKLPKGDKVQALAIAAGLSVVFQVAATFFVSRLLDLRFFQLAGGLLILWISVNLFRNDDSGRSDEAIRHGFWKAIWLIVAAELTMSTDNIFAVAAIAKGDFAVLLLGLGPSILLVVCASGFLSVLIEKFPLIVFGGAAILGNAAGEMIMTDAFTVDVFKPTALLRYCVRAAAVIGVTAAGYVIQRQRPALAVAAGPRDGAA